MASFIDLYKGFFDFRDMVRDPYNMFDVIWERHFSSDKHYFYLIQVVDVITPNLTK